MNYSNDDYRIAHDGFQSSATIRSPRSLRFRRLLVFLLVFLPCILVSQTFIFLQPAIYQSVATVLTVAPTDIDKTSLNADLEHITIQKQILLGPSILEKTVARLQQEKSDGTVWNVDRLRGFYSVEPVADTNLVQLRAEGPDAMVLQRAVNAWIDSYLQARADYIAESTEKVTQEIDDELMRIDRQVTDKRNEIDVFRMEHDIMSLESADNEAHARLQGLNRSLNAALEEEVKARAKLDALHDAISRGASVMPESDTRTMGVLVEQAQKLRGQVSEMESQYTEEYIRLKPNLRRIKEQLAQVEKAIADKTSKGESYAQHEAESNYTAARQAVIALQKQMTEHKKKASDYTTQFAKHQALQKELQKLETLQQETKQRLIEIDVKQRQKYPQVDVVDWASLPDKPIRPNYLQESVIAFAVSLALALMAVMIVEYLNREPMVPTPVTLTGIQLGQQHYPALDVSPNAPPRVVYDPLKTLAADAPVRELIQSEALALFQAAEPQAKVIIAFLLNGLTITEILNLTHAALNIEERLIKLPDQRTVPMTRCVSELFSGDNPPNWADADQSNALLCCAAIDGGLEYPEQINTETLRYTFMLFLIRQGIKMTDLTKIVGSLPPSTLLELNRFSPEHEGLPLEQIDIDFLPSITTTS